MAMEIPQQVGPYQVVRELGRGGMGLVLEVRHPQSPRPLAMKLILPGRAEPEAIMRFGREAQLLQKVQHTNVVRIHELGQAPQGQFMVTDLIEGDDLRKRIKQGEVPPRQAARIVRDLSDALSTLHQQGILHRDLKPENVILQPDGVPVLLDFGLARDDSVERLTKTGIVMGTPNYMAPEQADGMSPTQLDERLDVYGLGGILFSLLSGKPPVTGETSLQILHSVLKGELNWPEDAHKGPKSALYEIARRALATDRNDRYPNCKALGRDLDGYLRGGAAGKRKLKRKRKPIPMPVVAGGGILLLVGVLFLLFTRRSTQQESELLTPVIEVTTPASGAVLYEQAVAIEGRLLRGSGPCEVRVASTKKRVRPEPGKDDFRFNVELAEGDNKIVVEVLDVETKTPGQAIVLSVRRHSAPDWYQDLDPAERPRLPLPPKLSFGPGRGEYQYETDRSVLVYVPPGTFTMGADEERDNPLNNDPTPAHQVTLTKGYFIGKYEVSWKQFDAFCDDTRRDRKDRTINEDTPVPTDGHPAATIEWLEAAAYCKWAGLRLPTEAEWEYAGRGPQSFVFPWGNEPIAANAHTDTSNRAPTLVDALPQGASPFGAFHMAGNVGEWVYDTYARHPSEPQTDPLVFTGASRAHVLKNAGYNVGLSFCNLYARWGTGRVVDRTDHGFRVALSAE